ncbi:HAD family hydrolase [Streptomyces sp. XM4011]|uniref:Putative hydrolase of the HAD superfamily n=1 Tax=Streptomyces harbinensis TaxID=1176198 RepID=A0A1I6PHY6_9ACTN|nr:MULTISPECIES: HAD family hydrolase [Streptomyces]MCK1814352.1 HAD family hydrolase [Streptomyces sp. XM4011]QKV71524.1 HAD family hydrolase [Streptomyces harbinensis]SFS39831.1 putative hydrolase of the HAD superfamily [Streptomyces harbinensis]
MVTGGGVRAVVWDIDDTLFDYTGANEAGAREHFAAEGLPAGPAEIARWTAVMHEHYARYLTGELTFDEQRRERVRAFLGEPELPGEVAAAWFERFGVRMRAAWRLYPDVVPALDALTPRYRHGLLSNSNSAHQDDKLRRLGVRDRFEVLLCSEELGHAKPAPEAFAAACAAMRLEPAQVAYIGDQRITDAEAATAAGLHGIWLDRASSADGAGVRHRITTLAALPALLATLGG